MSSIGLISENDNSTVLAEYTGLNRVATSFQSEDALEKELIKTLVEQGYERLNINSEDELILNLRRQLEKLNNYHFHLLNLYYSLTLNSSKLNNLFL